MLKNNPVNVQNIGKNSESTNSMDNKNISINELEGKKLEF
jgi:hypothetical protein